MEKQNKKVFSTILLLVGALCIVVSGGIFVSRTWQYLPEIVKKMCLFAVTAGFFGGSVYADRHTTLNKTPLALYYLGVCFTGLSVIALFEPGWLEFSERLSIAILAMSLPVMIRFVREKDVADLILQICLTDGLILCVTQYGIPNPVKMSLLCVSAFSMILAAFVYYNKRSSTEDKKLTAVGIVAYGIHAWFSVHAIFGGMIFFDEFLFSVVPALLLAGSVTALYLAFENKALRVAQSLAILFASLAVVIYLVKHLPEDTIHHQVVLVYFGILLAGLVWMLVLGRRELVLISGIMTFLFTFLQIIGYTAAAQGYLYWEERAFCYPYGICMAFAILIWYYFREMEWEPDCMFKLAGLFFGMGIHEILCWAGEDYGLYYGLVFFASLFCLTAGTILDLIYHGRMKAEVAFARTFALFFAIAALLAHRIIPVVLYAKDGSGVIADFRVEYSCFFAGLGIVLLGFIWYSIYQGIRLVQFVGTCILLGILLLHNMMVPALPNVLVLAIATLVMLVAATLLKKRDYAFASAITLALVVLYLTREFWMSIAWWVYLFAAGVGLVIFAIKKEKAE